MKLLNLSYRILIMSLIWIPISVIAQNNTISAPIKQEKPTYRPPKKHSTVTAIDVSLAARVNGKMEFYTVNQWKSFTDKNKANIERIGLWVKSKSEHFIIDLYNNLDRKICSKKVSFQVAQNKSGGHLPSKQQWNLIKANHQKVRDALKAFGGDHLCSEFFWCQDGSLVDLSINGASSSSVKAEGMFRICTTDLENGFNDIVYNITPNDQYDIVCTSDNKKYSVIKYKNKWGIIRSDGVAVVPCKYDNFICGYNSFNESNNPAFPWYLEWNGLISAQRNNKWGYINIMGEEIIPCIFDEVEGCLYSEDSGAWVNRNNYYGQINRNGEFIYPLEFQSPIKHYNHQPARVKKNDKWGFLNENGSMLTPFIYDSTGVFGRDDDLAPVSQDGKYGYIDKSGDIVIPLQYSFADNFENGLAGIVCNGKVGFIDVKGKLIIPCIYEPVYSSDGVGKVLSWNDFYCGGVALVKQNNKWGIIDKKGEKVTDFIYDSFSYSSGGHFTAKLNGKDVFLDKGGNEYVSEEERSEKSDSILAYQGYPYEQYKMGKSYYRAKDYNKAYPWFKKSAEGGDDDGQCHLGYYYYYGYSPINKSDYTTAFSWFSKAAEANNRDACYFLGWMYEHGQGVSTDHTRALEWYKKSEGQRDAKERIEALTK